jgi:hypothetical protein
MILTEIKFHEASNPLVVSSKGNKFVMIYAIVSNFSESTILLSTWTQFSLYVNDVAMKHTMTGDEILLDGSIPPEKTTGGSFFFEVPENTTEVELLFQPDVTKDKYITFKGTLA